MGDGTTRSADSPFPGASSISERAAAVKPEALAQYELDAEAAYADLRSYLSQLGSNFYGDLVSVADRMEGRNRRRIPLIQKPGGQEATWTDRLVLREGGGIFDSYDFDSKLLYDKQPPLTGVPALRSYTIGIDRTNTKLEKGIHPQGIVVVTFGQGNIQKITIERKNHYVGYGTLGEIIAKRSGISSPSVYGTETPAGRFLYDAFAHDSQSNNFALEMIFPGPGIEPKIVLHHKAGNGKKALTSSYEFSKTDPEGKPEIAFRGNTHPKHRGLEAPRTAAYSDKALSVPQVKEVYAGIMKVFPR